MTFRPYPNRDRALRQLARHAQDAGPWRPDILFDPQADSLAPYPGGRALSDAYDEALDSREWRPGLKTGDYVLSTRPGVVGGPS